MTDLCDELRELAESIEACEWELPIDAIKTCNAAAIAIELARNDIAFLQRTVTMMREWGVRHNGFRFASDGVSGSDGDNLLAEIKARCCHTAALEGKP